MQIWLICAGDSSAPDEPAWVADAWDENAIEDNQEGFDEAIKKVERVNTKVALAIVEIPDDLIQKTVFPSPPVAQATGVMIAPEDWKNYKA